MMSHVVACYFKDTMWGILKLQLWRPPVATYKTDMSADDNMLLLTTVTVF